MVDISKFDSVDVLKKSFENLNLLKRFKYIYKILTGFGLKKFKAVNVLISEQ